MFPIHIACKPTMALPSRWIYFAKVSWDRYLVIPVFINGAAAPMPRTKRVIELGKVIGEYLKSLDERILIIGSGGLSHDPPTLKLAPQHPKFRNS